MTDPGGQDPWWASGRDPDEGLDEQDPFDAHHRARRGEGQDADGPDAAGADTARLASDAIDLVTRLAAEAGRRVADRARANAAGGGPGAFTRPDGPAGDAAGGAATGPVGPHEDGEVCDACPVCIGLRALRQVRPEVVAHLSDAAHHLSLALRAFADAQAGGGDDGLEKIDLDQ